LVQAEDIKPVDVVEFPRIWPYYRQRQRSGYFNGQNTSSNALPTTTTMRLKGSPSRQ
jgi:hypothetical protein